MNRKFNILYHAILGLLFSACAFADQSIYGGNNFPVGIAGGEGDLSESVPGNPGQDYPIFSEVPETSFVCDGQVSRVIAFAWFKGKMFHQKEI